MQKGVGLQDMITDRQMHDKLTAAFGNPYAAVIYISKLARQLSKTVDYDIPDSQALSWAITGVKPEPINVPRTIANTVRLPVRDVLTLVDDKEVKTAVVNSLRCSVHNYLCHTSNTLYNSDKVTQYSQDFMSQLILNNPDLDMSWLIFDYNGIEDEYRQSRVRILTRLIWTNFDY